MNLVSNEAGTKVWSKVDQDWTLVVRSVVEDAPVLESNKTIQNSRLLNSNKSVNPFQPDKPRLSYAFQAPAPLWRRFCRDHPDLHAGLHSRDALVRERAGATIARMHPEWVTCMPKPRLIIARR